MKRVAFLFLSFCCGACAAYATERPGSFMPGYETAEVRCLDKKDGKQRSTMSYELKRQARDAGIHYVLVTEGTGDWHTFRNVTFSGTTAMEERNGYLYPEETRFLVKERSGDPVISYHIDFDYDAQRIYWTSQGPDGKVIKQATYPLKGITTDPASMFHFLRPFAAKASEGAYESFYLLTFEPALYRVLIRQVPFQKDEARFEATQCMKLKFTADMGIVDNVLDRYVLHTYMWFEAAPPYDWLQYEGMETGMHSANVIAFVTHRTSREQEKP